MPSAAEAAPHEGIRRRRIHRRIEKGGQRRADREGRIEKGGGWRAAELTKTV